MKKEEGENRKEVKREYDHKRQKSKKSKHIFLENFSNFTGREREPLTLKSMGNFPEA